MNWGSLALFSSKHKRLRLLLIPLRLWSESGCRSTGESWKIPMLGRMLCLQSKLQTLLPGVSCAIRRENKIHLEKEATQWKEGAVNLGLLFRSEEKENCVELMTVHWRDIFTVDGCSRGKEEYFTEFYGFTYLLLYKEVGQGRRIITILSLFSVCVSLLCKSHLSCTIFTVA